MTHYGFDEGFYHSDNKSVRQAKKLLHTNMLFRRQKSKFFFSMSKTYARNQ